MSIKDLGDVGIILIPIILLLFFLPVQFGGNTYFLVILSGSMETEYPVGGLTILKETDEEIKIGDVIAFKLNEESEMLIVHRVIEITDEGYITKGDANENRDSGIITPEQVIARAEYIIPHIGYGFMRFANLLKTKLGVMSLIFVPASMILLSELRKIILVLQVDHVMKHLERKIK